jgi:hypothetical protein
MNHPIEALLSFLLGIVVATTFQLLPDKVDVSFILVFVGGGAAIGGVYDYTNRGRQPAPQATRAGTVFGLIAGLLFFGLGLIIGR